jgi:hypothetical protein
MEQGMTDARIRHSKKLQGKKASSIHFERAQNRNMDNRVYNLDFAEVQRKSLKDVMLELNTAEDVLIYRAQMASDSFFNNVLNGNNVIRRAIDDLAVDYYTETKISADDLKTSGRALLSLARSASRVAVSQLLYHPRSIITQAVPQAILNAYTFVAYPILMSGKTSPAQALDMWKAAASVSYALISDSKTRKRLVNASGKNYRSYVETHIEVTKGGYLSSVHQKLTNWIQNHYDRRASKLLTVPDGITVTHGAIMIAAMEAIKQGDKSVLTPSKWQPTETQIEAAHQITREMYSADTQAELAPVFKPDTAAKMIAWQTAGFLSKYPFNKIFSVLKYTSKARQMNSRKDVYTKQERNDATKEAAFMTMNLAVEAYAYGTALTYLWPYAKESLVDPVYKNVVAPMIDKFFELSGKGDYEEAEEVKQKIDEIIEQHMLRKRARGAFVEAALPVLGIGINHGLNYAVYLKNRSDNEMPMTYSEWVAAKEQYYTSFSVSNRSGASKPWWDDAPGAYGVVVGKIGIGFTRMSNANDGKWTSRFGNTYDTDEQGAFIARVVGLMDIASALFTPINMGGLTGLMTSKLAEVEQSRVDRNPYMMYSTPLKKKQAYMKLIRDIESSYNPMRAEKLVKDYESAVERGEVERRLQEMATKANRKADALMYTLGSTRERRDLIEAFMLDENEYIIPNEFDKYVSTVAIDRKRRGNLESYDLQAQAAFSLVNSEDFRSYVDEKQMEGVPVGAIEEFKLIAATYAKMDVMYGYNMKDNFIVSYAKTATLAEAKRQGYDGEEPFGKWIESVGRDEFLKKASERTLMPAFIGVDVMVRGEKGVERAVNRIKDLMSRIN